MQTIIRNAMAVRVNVMGSFGPKSAFTDMV